MSAKVVEEGMPKNYKPGDIDNSYYAKFLSPIELKVRNECVSAKNQKELLAIWSKYLFPERYVDQNGKPFKKLTDYERKAMIRILCKCDRLFLMLYLEGHEFYIRLMFANNFLFERSREVQRQPDNHLDLWPRGHYKSTFITKYGILQELLINPKLSILLITYTKEFGNETMLIVKRMLEDPKLTSLFNDILYQNPQKEAPKGTWTSRKLLLKGKTGFASLAVSSLIKNKTGHHANLLIFDDCVVQESVGLKQIRDKTELAMANALNLGSPGGEINRKQYTGTRYHLDDAWGRGIANKAFMVRKYTATKNGKEDGELVFLDRDTWNKQYMTMVRYSRMCQMFMNPGDVGKEVFKIDYLRFYDTLPRTPGSIFIFVDPASTKDKNSDYSSISVIMLAEEEKSFKNQYNIPIVHKYLIDGIRDKLDIGEMFDHLAHIYKKWDNFLSKYGIRGGVQIYYEQFGMQRDIALLQTRFNEENIYVEIKKMSGTRSPKVERINSMIPDLKLGRILLPRFGFFSGALKEFSIETDEVYKEKVFRFKDVDNNTMYKYYAPYMQNGILNHNIFVENDYSTAFSNNVMFSNIIEPIVKFSSYDKIFYDYTYEFISEYLTYPADHDDCLDSFSRYTEIQHQEYLVRTNMQTHYRGE